MMPVVKQSGPDHVHWQAPVLSFPRMTGSVIPIHRDPVRSLPFSVVPDLLDRIDV
jgi:hypothetical protein